MNEPLQPSDQPSPRMGRLARLPVFYALDGKRVVVAGGNAAAAWKTELLSATGATVDVFARELSSEMTELAGDPAQGDIVIHRRDCTQNDLAGAAMAIGACDDEGSAARFVRMARAAGVPVNVIDKPDFCDFAFGAIVNRSPLVVGISTDGAAPVFAQAVRAKIEAMLPSGFASWAKAAQAWRAALKESGLSFNARRKFWQVFTGFAVANPNHEPLESDFVRLLSDVKERGDKVEQGSVMLVGAGPGDPEFLTLRAVRALQSADVILFDDLVSREILDFARREAKKMLVGKSGYGPSCKQTDINDTMIALARSGKRVVRLKGGDPMIFGRAGEEIEACRKAGIAVDVVPGITAAQGAASSLRLSLSHRLQARRIQYITGHAQNGALPDDLDWASIADPSATTAIYMPTRTFSALSERALAQGLDARTPVIAISRATRPDEHVIVGMLGDMAARLAEEMPQGPLLVLIGRVLEGYRAARVDGQSASARPRYRPEYKQPINQPK
jgi:uroporphyrin-III C-methyltransferase/precorrin-2 dehydrogenase/sirohydrochlorin ferrochelatase